MRYSDYLNERIENGSLVLLENTLNQMLKTGFSCFQSIYYHLYITYMLTGFLFNLDQSNICYRDMQKIEILIRTCIPNTQKIYKITKRLQTPEDEVEQYFPGFMTIIDCTTCRLQIQSMPKNNINRKVYFSMVKKKNIESRIDSWLTTNTRLVS